MLCSFDKQHVESACYRATISSRSLHRPFCQTVTLSGCSISSLCRYCVKQNNSPWSSFQLILSLSSFKTKLVYLFIKSWKCCLHRKEKGKGILWLNYSFNFALKMGGQGGGGLLAFSSLSESHELFPSSHHMMYIKRLSGKQASNNSTGALFRK